jgi:hypothetical protein
VLGNNEIGIPNQRILHGPEGAESHRSKKLARAAQNEAIRIRQARGHKLEEIDHLPPEAIARAGEGDLDALKTYDERRLSRVERGELKQDPRHITELWLNRGFTGTAVAASGRKTTKSCIR